MVESPCCTNGPKSQRYNLRSSPSDDEVSHNHFGTEVEILGFQENGRFGFRVLAATYFSL